MADALSRRPDFELSHQKSLSRATAQVESSTLAAMKAYHVTSSLASDRKECYSQDEHCRLLLDHFGGRKVTLLSHLKAKLNCFSYSDGLLWHQLSPCDPLRIYVPHDTDLKLMILHECHDAPSSGHLGREKTFLRVSNKNLVAPSISVGGQLYSLLRRVSSHKACTFKQCATEATAGSN